MLPSQIIDLFESTTQATLRSTGAGRRLGGASAMLKLAFAGSVLDAGIQMATAPRGKIGTTAIRSAAGNIGGLLGGLTGSFLGASIPIIGPFIGDIIGQQLGYEIGYRASKPIEDFAGFNRQVTRLRMGGDFEDYQAAYTMRQRAAQEMGSSLLNARQYLGQEAALFHA